MSFKIYTKTGDQGETSIYGGKRLPKHHVRIEAYGTVDELNAQLGLLKDTLPESNQLIVLKAIQNRLFTIGSNLASDPDKGLTTPDILPTDIEQLEQAIDQMEEPLPALKHFILPGGHPVVSQCHIARTVCRRSERIVVALGMESEVDPIILQYLNRLSDYLFVLARKIAQDLGVEEVIWNPRKG